MHVETPGYEYGARDRAHYWLYTTAGENMAVAVQGLLPKEKPSIVGGGRVVFEVKGTCEPAPKRPKKRKQASLFWGERVEIAV